MSVTSSNHAKIHEASRECVWLRSVTQHIRKSCGISSGQESPTVKSGDIIVQKVRSSDNQADLFTKALPTTIFKKLVHDTGMRRVNELKFSKQDMDIFAFIRTTDPTKVKVVERERQEYEPWLLETIVGCTILLLPVEQGDSTGGGDGQDTVIQPVTVTTNIVAEDVILLQPRRQRKRKTIISDAVGPSHPPKRLREDHVTPSGASIGGKSRFAVQRLLARAVQNYKVRGELLPTFPFVTSSVSATPEREDEGDIDSITRLNLRTINAPPFVSIITTATTVTSTVDPAVVVKEKVVKPSLVAADSSSVGGADPNAGIFSDLTRSDFLVSGVRIVIDPDTDLQKVYVPRLSMTNGSRLDDGRVCREMVDEFAPPKLFASVRGMELDQSAVDEKDELLKFREMEIENIKAHLLLKEAEATEALLLSSVKVREQEVADLDAVFERFQDEKMKVMNDKFDKLYIDFIEMTLHLEERFYPHLLTTIAGRRWLLTYDMELAVAKCLNSSEYLSALGAAIGKAIEKGMQDGLAAGITHGKEGRVLADVAAYNPSAEVDYVSALQQLQSVNFSLLTELKLNKDSSVETLMNILRLEETLAERLGLNESQPHVDQLMVPIHHSPDQTVVGATALSLSLDVSHARVQKIRENIAKHRSALCDIFIPLPEPFSTVAVPATTDTTTALSTTLASASTIIPISVDDYDVAGTDDQAAVNENVANDNATGGDVNPFPNVDNAELNVPE
ncbi:hypothetical protein Tco_0496192 [Tanacetum coccineum]